MTLFFAGHETTAHAMTWAWYLLAKYPKVTARLQREIDAVTGGGRLTVEHLKAIPYLDWVVSEGMRILPSVWVFMKEPTQDTTLRGVRIPKGAPILISPYVLQHDARWFPSPETFDPERFSPERVGSIPKGAYVPFSGGSRTCLGRGFAMMEAQLIIGTLAQRLQPTVPVDYVPTKQAVLSLQPEGGLPIDVVLRPFGSEPSRTADLTVDSTPAAPPAKPTKPSACPMSSEG
jgi:cytochrome P450